MLESILCLGLGISAILFVGIPVTYYLWVYSDKENKSQITFWTTALFAGVSVICTVVKFLFMLNIPVASYGRIFYIISFILFLIFIWREHNGVTYYFRAPVVLLFSTLTYGLNSIAYIFFGAQYYKGYSWWDVYYYGTQAEAVRSIPFSRWAEMTASKIWMIGTTLPSLFSGVHRISMGALGAMVASLAGVDGSSVIGFWIALSSLMLYGALLYATEKMFASKGKQCIICLFAVMLPGIVVSQLECFLPMAFFMSFSVFYCRCFFDFLKKNSIRRIIFLSIIISAQITFLLDGTYLLCGLMIVSIVWILHSKVKCSLKEICKKILGMLIIFLLAVILNIQYFPYIWEELHSDMSREFLNGLYGFAYSPTVFDWIFYGGYSFLEKFPKMLATVFTLLAVLMFLAGICGLVIQTIQKNDGITLNFLAVFCASLLFYSQPGEHQYAFLKVLHFSFAPIVIGIFIFIKYVRRRLWGRGRLLSFWRSAAAGGVCIFMSICMICSFTKILGVFPKFDKWAGRFAGKPYTMTEEAVELFEKMKSGKSPVLLVSSDKNAGMQIYWASYYGTNRDVYVMSESELRSYLVEEKPDAEFLNPPLDCEIISIGPASQSVFPEEKRKDYALFLEREGSDDNTNIATNIANLGETAQNFSLYVYAKERAKVKLSINLDANTKIWANGQEEVSDMEGNPVDITLELDRGVNTIPISGVEGEIKINGYCMHILQEY